MNSQLKSFEEDSDIVEGENRNVEIPIDFSTFLSSTPLPPTTFPYEYNSSFPSILPITTSISPFSDFGSLPLLPSVNVSSPSIHASSVRLPHISQDIPLHLPQLISLNSKEKLLILLLFSIFLRYDIVRMPLFWFFRFLFL
jgi:hypothetical protein